MKTLILSTLLALMAIDTRAADIITLTGNATYTLGSNDVAEILSVAAFGNGPQGFVFNGSLNVTTASTSGGIVSLLPIVLTGPSNTIAATTSSTSPGSQVTFRLRTKAEYLSSLAVPSVAVSSSVVIPEDAAGPVTMVMESSTDMVTWTAANPGTYGTSTPRRFFRIRAVRN